MAEEEQEEVLPTSPERRFEDFVRENPLAVVAGAFIAGVLLGRLGWI